MMVTTTRTSTPSRWRTALKRALSEGIEVRQLQGSGMWIATSASDPNAAYEVSPWECECQAGQFDDPVCKHRAALLLKLGRLRTLAPPEGVQVNTCHTCNGTGVLPARLNRERAIESGFTTCEQCEGTGFSTSRHAA